MDSEPIGPVEKFRWTQPTILAAACALVIGIYAVTAHSGYLVSSSLNPADAYYNLLVQGFRAGQLSLKKEVPPGLTQLADPYDPAANARYHVLDLSYYKGRFYLYFGVTPAVVLFWPYVVLTGNYLLQQDAVLVFCTIGFLVSVGLLCAVWRRYFAGIGVAVAAAGALALGLATFTPYLMARCDVYEVSISCGYAFTMLALAAVWKALHDPQRRGGWLAAASVAYGLAVGARPSLLFGAVILLVPTAQAWRERRKISGPLIAATGPLLLIGLGLMFYNARRFENPFEFGWHYQLAGGRQEAARPFDVRYLWFNFRMLFFEPVRWSGRFPFVHETAAPLFPAGHGGGQKPFAVLTAIPWVWLSVAVPLAWRGRSAEARFTLRWFLAAVALLFGICALTICLHRGANVRYEVEFLPALVLLAAIGVLGLERALAPAAKSGLTRRAAWRRATRWGWGLLLGFSVAFNLLVCLDPSAQAHNELGFILANHGRATEAIAHFQRALSLKPDYAEAHNNLGVVLKSQGNLPEAIAHFEEAVRIKPDLAEAHNNLGIALGQAGRTQESIECYEQTLQLWPDYAQVHSNLGVALAGLGRFSEAIQHCEQAVRIDPDSAPAHYNLGDTLERAGRVPEAMTQYEQALRLKPDFVEAQRRLAQLQAAR